MELKKADSFQVGDDVIAWIDIETDGLNQFGGHLLEVACILTNTDLEVISTNPYHAVVQYDSTKATSIHDNADRFVQDMHSKTGLWLKLPTGKPLSQVQDELLAFINEYAPTPRSVRIAGSSIRFDMNWIQEHLPAIYEHLHYRFIDVTTIKTLFEWWGIEVPGIELPDEVQHVALNDIVGSLHVLQKHKEMIMKLV